MQDPRDTHDQLIAGVVAETVVDVLEMVQVDHQQRACRGVPANSRHVGAECLVESTAIEQTSQRVVVGHVP